jgi:xylan 1,4-beta-xylosidase
LGPCGSNIRHIEEGKESVRSLRSLHRWSALVALSLLANGTQVAGAQTKTYCNPLDLDYAFERKPVATEKYPSHRSTADPVCVRYGDKYYLFSTNQEGYWWSADLSQWHFTGAKFKSNDCGDQVCAPAAWPTDEGLLFLPSFVAKDKMPLYLSKDPVSGKWQEIVDSFPIATWDPAIFQDEDKRIYIYWGSSNLYPIYGVEVDAKNQYKPIGKPVELIKLAPQKHGWEQFGEDNQNGKMDPFIEGAWMNKIDGRYYLQYGAPGTEFNVYGDGVYVGDKPLGPFTYQQHNPFSWKPTGFARGAGHGSTFADRYGNFWHVATMDISVKHTFERRIGMFPAGVDKDGVLFCDTAFGDYPHYIPTATGKSQSGEYHDFTGWMLLSYMKKARADASMKGHGVELATDENIKTYWSAPDGKRGHYLSLDLARAADVKALQINYADEGVNLFGKHLGLKHRFKILHSLDGKTWQTLVDRSSAAADENGDTPHAYIELPQAVKTRYLKIENIEMAAGSFAVQDFRVFGKAPGEIPPPPEYLRAARSSKDKRNVTLNWPAVPGTYAYAIDFGTAPDKLYSSLLVYGPDSTSYSLHSLNLDTPYYFRIRSVAESGLSQPGATCAATFQSIELKPGF